MRRIRWPLRPQASSHHSPLAPPASAAKPRCRDASLLSGLRADWDECGVACGAAVRARDGSREGYACAAVRAIVGPCWALACACALRAPVCSNESSVSTVFRFDQEQKPKPTPSTELYQHQNRTKNQKPKKPTYRFGSVRFSVYGYNVPRLSETAGPSWVVGLHAYLISYLLGLDLESPPPL
jgi:hypothetical protein